MAHSSLAITNARLLLSASGRAMASLHQLRPRSEHLQRAAVVEVRCGGALIPGQGCGGGHRSHLVVLAAEQIVDAVGLWLGDGRRCPHLGVPRDLGAHLGIASDAHGGDVRVTNHRRGRGDLFELVGVELVVIRIRSGREGSREVAGVHAMGRRGAGIEGRRIRLDLELFQIERVVAEGQLFCCRGQRGAHGRRERLARWWSGPIDGGGLCRRFRPRDARRWRPRRCSPRQRWRFDALGDVVEELVDVRLRLVRLFRGGRKLVGGRDHGDLVFGEVALVRHVERWSGRRGALPARLVVGEQRIEECIRLEVEPAELLADAAGAAAPAGTTGVGIRLRLGIVCVAHRTPMPSFSRKER